MKLEQKHITAALAVLNYDQLKPLSVANKAIEIAIAEASVPVPTDEFISADQARALGAGAEYYQPESERWITCEHLERFPASFHDGEVIKYRAIKQPKPIEPTCQVQLIGGEVQTMTRESAKALQAETRDTHDWLTTAGRAYADYPHFTFNDEGIYTYSPKAKKVISWSQMPVGVRTLHGELRSVDKAGKNANIEILEVDFNDVFIQPVETRHLTLAPASEQKWIAVQDNQNIAILLEDLFRNGITTKMHHSAEKYRIVGIESGYVLGGN